MIKKNDLLKINDKLKINNQPVKVSFLQADFKLI